MQTFLPSSNFRECARVLDNKRLGKQRVEAYQILKALSDSSYGWQNHPAVKMWRGYPEALQLYLNAMIREWKSRGFKNTMGTYMPMYSPMPHWLTNYECRLVVASHRANLLRKDPEHYSRFGWTEEPQEGYYWPIS